MKLWSQVETNFLVQKFDRSRNHGSESTGKSFPESTKIKEPFKAFRFEDCIFLNKVSLNSWDIMGHHLHAVHFFNGAGETDFCDSAFTTQRWRDGFNPLFFSGTKGTSLRQNWRDTAEGRKILRRIMRECESLPFESRNRFPFCTPPREALALIFIASALCAKRQYLT